MNLLSTVTRSLIAWGAVLCAFGAVAHARPASELACIEQLFNDEQARAMAQLGSDDKAASDAAMAKVDFMMLGMGSRMCALRGHWSENEYATSVGYVMAWPTMRGLRLAGEAQGYAAIDRAYAAQSATLTRADKLEDVKVTGLLSAARADGLLLPPGEQAERDARRYIDVLWKVDRMRADFEAGRKPRR